VAEADGQSRTTRFDDANDHITNAWAAVRASMKAGPPLEARRNSAANSHASLETGSTIDGRIDRSCPSAQYFEPGRTAPASARPAAERDELFGQRKRRSVHTDAERRGNHIRVLLGEDKSKRKYQCAADPDDRPGPHVNGLARPASAAKEASPNAS
jgi:hypothetical protein